VVSRVLFDHVAIGVARMADAAPFLSGELGGIPDAGAIRSGAAFAWGTYRYAGGGSIEVLEPIGPQGFVQRFLAERGPGIHHVTFKVPSLDAVCARAEAAGRDIVGRDDSDPEWREAFLHPKQALGIVVQFAQPGPSDGGPPSALPPAVPSSRAPVTVLGLSLRCQSPERALTLWSTVLQGRVTEQPDGTLRFSWPGSFMRIDVELDPVQSEGPIAIELAPASRPLPAAAHPVLGAVFREAAA
jgi:catechol 2,3-dioxygenase-like lactoylglutathione lyase family enzyme